MGQLHTLEGVAGLGALQRLLHEVRRHGSELVKLKDNAAEILAHETGTDITFDSNVVTV